MPLYCPRHIRMWVPNFMRVSRMLLLLLLGPVVRLRTNTTTVPVGLNNLDELVVPQGQRDNASICITDLLCIYGINSWRIFRRIAALYLLLPRQIESESFQQHKYESVSYLVRPTQTTTLRPPSCNIYPPPPPKKKKNHLNIMPATVLTDLLVLTAANTTVLRKCSNLTMSECSCSLTISKYVAGHGENEIKTILPPGQCAFGLQKCENAGAIV